MRRALVLGVNGCLGRSVSRQLIGKEWHVIGADVAGTAEDGVEFIKMNSAAGSWADELQTTTDALPELDLVVSTRAKTRFCLTLPANVSLAVAR